MRKLNKIKPVILCGDLNVAYQKIDIANPKIKPTAGWTKEEKYNFSFLLNTQRSENANRATLNHSVLNQCTSPKLIKKMLNIPTNHVDVYEDFFVDIFRSLYPNKKTYTFWSYMNNARENNKGWRLDYFILSQKLIPNVKDVVIFTHLLKPDLYQNILSSDHCPSILYLTEVII